MGWSCGIDMMAESATEMSFMQLQKENGMECIEISI